MNYRIGVTRYDGFVLGWVFDLPGCVAEAPDEDSIAGPLRLTVSEHRAWLRGMGAQTPPFDGHAVDERVEAADYARTGGEFCFANDREPVSGAVLDDLLRRIDRAREELLQAADLPEEILDWEPPATAIGARDPWAPEPRTAREILLHALQLEVYYRGGLGEGEGPGIFEQVQSPAMESARTEERLREAWRAGRGSWWVTRPRRPQPEEWTVRKVARRLIAHHRVHAAEIAQRRTWVVPGGPNVARQTSVNSLTRQARTRTIEVPGAARKVVAPLSLCHPDW